MKTCSLSSLLAASVEEHVILMFAIDWLGDLSLGFLIQVVEVMECEGRSISSSI